MPIQTPAVDVNATVAKAKKLALKWPAETGNKPNTKLEYLTQVVLTAKKEGGIEFAASVTSVLTDATGALMLDTRQTRENVPTDLDGDDVKAMGLDKVDADQRARKVAEAERDERAEKAAKRKARIAKLEALLTEHGIEVPADE